MKKILYFLLLILIIGCTKDTNIEADAESEVLIESDLKYNNENIASADIVIRCNGFCGTEIPVCYAEFDNEEAWCSCDDCSMTVTQKEGIEINYYSGSINNTMMKVKEVVGIEEYESRKVFSIGIGFDKERERELIWLEGIHENGEAFTSIVVLNYNQMKMSPNSGISDVEVDCSGDCGENPSPRGCVEVYNFSTGEVYCACESDNCKMTVTTN